MFFDSLVKSRLKPSTTGKKSVYRSIAKTISWRVLGTLDTVIISYLLTGTIKVALSIGAVEVVSKMLLYYLHERAWEHYQHKAVKTK